MVKSCSLCGYCRLQQIFLLCQLTGNIGPLVGGRYSRCSSPQPRSSIFIPLVIPSWATSAAPLSRSLCYTGEITLPIIVYSGSYWLFYTKLTRCCGPDFTVGHTLWFKSSFVLFCNFSYLSYGKFYERVLQHPDYCRQFNFLAILITVFICPFEARLIKTRFARLWSQHNYLFYVIEGKRPGIQPNENYVWYKQRKPVYL